MKQIEKLLPLAMEALKDEAVKMILTGNCMLKEYDGYAASFAPSVITAGLKSTLSFYSDQHKDDRSGPRRNHVLQKLHLIYRKKYAEGGGLTGDDLLTIALNRQRTTAELNQMRKDLINCAVALKLVMRNFKQVETAPGPEINHETETQP